MPAPKLIAIPYDLYESIKVVSERQGYEKVSGFVTDLFTEYGFDSDDVKLVLRIPAQVAKNKEETESFLKEKIHGVVNQLFE